MYGSMAFGPVKYNKCVIDNGCSSLLLPWPSDPSVLKSYLNSCFYTVVIDQGERVSGAHATVSFEARDSFFPVCFGSTPCVLSIEKLRFALTEEARVWLDRRKIPDLPPKHHPSIHAENPAFALVGQAILRGMVSLQCLNAGVLLIPVKAISAPLEDMIQLGRKMEQSAKEDKNYKDHLKDLKGHCFGVDVYDRICAPGTRRSYREQLLFGF